MSAADRNRRGWPEPILALLLRRGWLGTALDLSAQLAHALPLGPLRLGRRLLRALPALRLIAPHVDGKHYLRQLPAKWRRFAQRDPVVHYGLVGRFRGYSPRPGFDPIFYRAENPDLGLGRDALAHFARRAATRTEPVATSPLDGRSLPLTDGARERGHFVTLSHARGGGSERYLALYEDKLGREGCTVTRLARDTIKAPLFRPTPLAPGGLHGPTFLLPEDDGALKNWFRESGATRLVVNHVIDLPFECLAWLPEACAEVGLPFDIMVHDYLALCPRINLVDRTGRFCGGPHAADCDACVSDRRGLATEIEPAAWRRATEGLLRRADRIIAPHADVAQRLRDHWPDLAVDVWEPEDESGLGPPVPPRLAPEAPLRIGIVGALNRPKGFDVVERLASFARAQRLPLEFVLIGPSQDDDRLAAAGVRVAGRYREAEAAEAIRQARPDVAFVPAIWPETWSFTLTLALQAGLPVYAFDIGAVAARLRRLGLGTLVPLSRAEDPAFMAGIFMEARRLAVVSFERQAASVSGVATSRFPTSAPGTLPGVVR